MSLHVRWFSQAWLAALLLLVLPLPYQLVEAAPKSTTLPPASSFFVHSVPGIQQDPQHPLRIYAGHLPAESNATRLATNDVTAHIYFMMVKNRRAADRERVIFWFNGGPGCSSFDGAMMEVGPWRWDGQPAGKESFNVKEGGWEEYATMVFIDQPPGTGFSFTSTNDYAKTIKEVQAHLLEFMRNFYSVFPEYKYADTYMAGESFAGQWIPYFADAVLASNLDVPLKGIAIGNGWMDAKRQYLSYLDYAVKMNLLEENSEDWKHVKKSHEKCEAAIEKVKGEPMKIHDCASVIMGVINKKTADKDGKRMCLNMYDVRYEDTYPACGMNWPPEMHAITDFLGRPLVVNALHASAHPGAWTECKRDVHRAFREGEEQSSITVLPNVLSKIPVLLFAGDQDLICNYVGIENMIKDLSWNGEKGLGTVQTQTWNVNGSSVGTWVNSRNLTYVKIFNASHMVPFDVPHVTHDMMLRFMNVNFTSIYAEGTARIPSSLGPSAAGAKPIFLPSASVPSASSVPVQGKTPEQEKAMWEAYYNAGSAALVLVLIFAAVGLWMCIRNRRKGGKGGLQLPLAGAREDEESIPLNPAGVASERHDNESSNGNGRDRAGSVKGKERARQSEAIFEVGDTDDEDDEPSKRRNGGDRL
ncbi:pheromone-processing carboxypeptidase KEX1 [Ephemerocybe angulata]|uniref:Pheromone-processing carboxypeptidase KEX1 n=1 Tax=Ephemerocybe angulata TaxID=980116 RepID=A0A8H6ID58_9AGAR|nr:pheromone-processing carboxypeptidase KEX1 [Tulosesus angulatus]